MNEPRRSPQEPLHASLHQPPNPSDLVRMPPGNTECARIRGMMRDFADGDLQPQDLRLVEEHAHGCHVCSVELSRAEHEVVRLRRAFARLGEQEARTVAPLDKDFAARVVERLVRDETGSFPQPAPSTDPDPSANADSSANPDPSAGRDVPDSDVPDSRVLDALARAGGASVAASRRGHEGRVGGGTKGPGQPRANGRRGARSGSPSLPSQAPALLLAIAAILLVVFGGVALFHGAGDREPDRVARLVVTEATGAFGNGRRLLSGEGLGDHQDLTVLAGGGASLDWHDFSAESQPAATLRLDGQGRLRLKDGSPLLLDGSLHVETHRPVAVAVEGGPTVQLGIGEYVIAADAVDSLANEKLQPSMQDPLASAPGDLRVQIEVLRGDAQILGADRGPTLIAQGNVGIFEGGAMSTRPIGRPVTSDVVARGPSAPAAVPTLPSVAAFVHERSGVPSVGTAIGMAYAAAASVHVGFGATNANGAFVHAPEVPCESDFLVLHAIPAVTRLELGIRAPDAYRVLRNGAEVRCASSLVLDVSLPLAGVVVDEQEQPRLGVRVLPCIVDELFGTMLPLTHRLAYTDQEGLFQIHQLPVALPHHQFLALLVVHPNLRPVVVPVPTRGSAVALQPLPPIVLPALRTVRLHQLPPNTTVTVIEEVEGVPKGSSAWQRVFTTDSHGKVAVASVGRGDLWLRTGSESYPQVKKFVLDEVGDVPRYRPSSVMTPQAQAFDPLVLLAGTDLLVAGTYRHQHFLLSSSENAATGLAMVVKDALGRAVPDAQVFAVTPTGPRGRSGAIFLGFTSSNGVISLDPVADGGDIVVVGPDGSVAFVASPQQAVLTIGVTLETAGRVLVQPSLRPSGNNTQSMVAIRFERIGPVLPGMEPVAHRFASEATGWEVGGLPPGLYRAYIGSTDSQIIVPPGGFASLE